MCLYHILFEPLHIVLSPKGLCGTEAKLGQVANPIVMASFKWRLKSAPEDTETATALSCNPLPRTPAQMQPIKRLMTPDRIEWPRV